MNLEGSRAKHRLHRRKTGDGSEQDKDAAERREEIYAALLNSSTTPTLPF